LAHLLSGITLAIELDIFTECEFTARRNVAYVIQIVGGPDDGLVLRSDSHLAAERVVIQELLSGSRGLPGDRVVSYPHTSRPLTVLSPNHLPKPVVANYEVMNRDEVSSDVHLVLKYLGWQP